MAEAGSHKERSSAFYVPLQTFVIASWLKEDSETLIYKSWTHISILCGYIEQNIFSFYSGLYGDYMTYKNFKAREECTIQLFSHKSCWMSKPVGVRDFLGGGQWLGNRMKIVRIGSPEIFTQSTSSTNPMHSVVTYVQCITKLWEPELLT